MRSIYLFVLVNFTILHAQNYVWEYAIGNNLGGRCTSIAYDKFQQNHIWISTAYGGLYESYDNGTNWQAVNTYHGVANTSYIIQDDLGNLYVSTGSDYLLNIDGQYDSSVGNGIYKSTDNGQTWVNLEQTNIFNSESTTTTSGLFSHINVIKVSPSNNNLVIFGGLNGVGISQNGGIGFNSWSHLFNFYNVNDVEFTADGQTLFVLSSNSLFRSTDVSNNFAGGWQQMLPSEDIINVAVSSSNSNEVWVVSKTAECLDEIWKSEDGGDNWTMLYQCIDHTEDPFNEPTSISPTVCYGASWYANELMVNPLNNDEIIIGGMAFYTFSVANGMNRYGKVSSELTDLNSPEYLAKYIRNIQVNPFNSSEMMIATDRGVFKVTNQQGNWTFSNINYGNITLEVGNFSVGLSGDILYNHTGQCNTYHNCANETDKKLIRNYGLETTSLHISRLLYKKLFIGRNGGLLLRSDDQGENFSSILSPVIDQGNCGHISCAPNDCYTEYVSFYYNSHLLETKNMSTPIEKGYLYAMDDTLFDNGTFYHIYDTLFPNYMLRCSTAIATNVTYCDTLIQNGNYFASSQVNKDLKYPVTLTQTILPGDSSYFMDRFDAKYFVSTNCGLWMCTNPLQEAQAFSWYRISNNSYVTDMDNSKDGDVLFTLWHNNISVYTGFNELNQYLDPLGCSSTACTQNYLNLKTINLPTSNNFNSISVDASNPNRLLVSSSNLIGATKLLLVTNALSANPVINILSTPSVDTGYLVINSCLIDKENPNRFFIGTKHGVYVSEDAGQTWTKENTGLPLGLNVTQMKQEYLYDTACLVTYLSTYGGGIFRDIQNLPNSCQTQTCLWYLIDSTLEPTDTSAIRIRDEMQLDFQVYPNPSDDFVNVCVNSKDNNENLSIFVYNGNGVFLFKTHFKQGEFCINNLNVSNLPTGNYFFTIAINEQIIQVKNFIRP